MTKFIVNERTHAWKTDVRLIFTIRNCQIVHCRLLTHHINYKFMCLSAYWQWKLANVRARFSTVNIINCVSLYIFYFILDPVLTITPFVHLLLFWFPLIVRFLSFSNDAQYVIHPGLDLGSWTIYKKLGWMTTQFLFINKGWNVVNNQ